MKVESIDNSNKTTLRNALSQPMINQIKREKINNYSFIRVFCSLLIIKDIRKIDISKLGHDLIDFYNDKRYEDLFDMPIKNQIEGDFVDLSDCLQQAMLTGLITSKSIQNTNDRLILLTKEQAQDNIASYDYAYISKMNDLVDKYISRINFRNLKVACSKYPEMQLNPNGKPFINEATPKYIVDNFVENGFVENFCLTDEELKEVKKLRLEKKLRNS